MWGLTTLVLESCFVHLFFFLGFLLLNRVSRGFQHGGAVLQLQAVQAMIFHQKALPCGSLREGWMGCVTGGVLFSPQLAT